MIRRGEETQMVTIVSCALRSGGRIEVRAPRLEARWLGALFARNPAPFAALRAMGYTALDAAIADVDPEPEEGGRG